MIKDAPSFSSLSARSALPWSLGISVGEWKECKQKRMDQTAAPVQALCSKGVISPLDCTSIALAAAWHRPLHFKVELSAAPARGACQDVAKTRLASQTWDDKSPNLLLDLVFLRVSGIPGPPRPFCSLKFLLRLVDPEPDTFFRHVSTRAAAQFPTAGCPIAETTCLDGNCLSVQAHRLSASVSALHLSGRLPLWSSSAK